MDDKDTIRGLASAARQKQPDALATSRIITDRLMNLGVYQRAECVLWYVGVRHEVATRQALPAALAEGTRTVVPYCLGERLELFRLTKMDQLTRGAYGIPEPVSALRENPEFRVDAAELDLVVVPGVAFDVHGGRLGHGQGYYDRLLAGVRRRTVLVGIAFDCQVVDRVPVEDHDVRMDVLVTQSRTVFCREQGGLHVGDEAC